MKRAFWVCLLIFGLIFLSTSQASAQNKVVIIPLLDKKIIEIEKENYAPYFEKIVRNFSRYNKYTLGSELTTVSRDIVKFIIKANSAREKLPVLYEMRERLEEMKILIRIA